MLAIWKFAHVLTATVSLSWRGFKVRMEMFAKWWHTLRYSIRQLSSQERHQLPSFTLYFETSALDIAFSGMNYAVNQNSEVLSDIHLCHSHYQWRVQLINMEVRHLCSFLPPATFHRCFSLDPLPSLQSSSRSSWEKRQTNSKTTIWSVNPQIFSVGLMRNLSLQQQQQQIFIIRRNSVQNKHYPAGSRS